VPIIQPSAQAVPLLRAVVLALKAMDKQTRSDINKETRKLTPTWSKAVDARARTRMDSLVFGKGSRVVAGNPTRLIAANSRRAIPGGGGFTPDVHGRALEFGANRNKESEPYSRKGSKRFSRKTNTGLPAPYRKGRVIYAAFADVAPKITSLYVQIVVRNLHESFEKR
jgi:hypothetical protein